MERNERLTEYEIEQIHDRYRKRWEKDGYSPTSLGWGKAKQSLRFKKMFEKFDIKGTSILDIGCGFGDLNLYLEGEDYEYLGIDIVKEFVEEGSKRYQTGKIKFVEGEFLKYEFTQKYDYCVESGIFNHVMYNIDNYTYIDQVMKKGYDLCNCACIFDFRSDKVDYFEEGLFYNDPSKILEMGYQITKRVLLDNSYMPYEFLIILYKNDQVDYEKLCYQPYSQY